MQDKIKQLIEEELARANEKFPPFASAHEGYAVLLEEVEETREQLNSVEFELRELWSAGIRDDDLHWQEVRSSLIIVEAVQLIAEAIQVAAMARKIEQFLEREGKRE